MSAHGLHYPDSFLVSLPVLLPRPAPHAPIRALSAAQFAQIRHLHLTADVPDAVLFPFLHGLEGDNHAQNLFFSKHGSKVAVPAYRGLVWVVCDDDDPAQQPADEQDELALDDDDRPAPRGAELRAESLSRAIPGDRRRSDASSLSSSVESIFSQSMSSTLSVSTAATSIHSPNPSTSCSSLSSSPAPKPCTPSHLLTSTFRPAELLTTSPDGPVFVAPAVPKGMCDAASLCVPD